MSTTPPMKPEFFPAAIPGSMSVWFDALRVSTPWVNKDGAPRDEATMSTLEGRTYSYGRRDGAERVYDVGPMTGPVKTIQDLLNTRLPCNTSYNFCVLNYYADHHQHLGWHSDDSPEQDLEHPIAVVAFGAARHIYYKHRSFKGPIPEEQKILMTPGSLFIMPAGFQAEHVHKIPKHPQPCGPRLSLTFRRLK